MIRFALAVLLLLCAAPALADSEARNGADFVRLTARPCADAKVLELIAAAGDNHLDYRAAHAEIGGVPYAACWRPLMNREVVHVRYADSDQGLIPFGHLKPVRSV